MEQGDATLSQPPMRIITTERLHLRTLQVSDAEAAIPLLSSEETMRWTTQRPVTDVDQARQWLSARALGPDVVNFAIFLRSEPSTMIGVAGSFHPPKIGYLFHPDYFKRGYATETLRALVPALFQYIPPVSSESGTGHDYLEAWVDTRNAASKRVLEKSGFTQCETLPEKFESPVMGWGETVIYRLARPSKTLDGLGLLPPNEGSGGNGERPVPPIE